MSTPPRLEPFVKELAFPESPRWHAGALWFSDFYQRRVCRVAGDGRVEAVVEVPDQPSGLGWLPDGRLLVVSMNDRRLLRLDGTALAAVADLSALAAGPCNDMLVDAQGRAYIGNFGFDLHGRAPFAATCLVMVPPGGAPQVVARDLEFPNGTVLSPDGRTLIVAESYGQRLTAFDVRPDGSLAQRRVWAQLAGRGVAPDGICLDAQGAVWLASPVSREVMRVQEGGAITHRVPTEGQAVACMLGGPDRRTLFVLTGRVMVTPQQSLRERSGAIWRMRVEVPGAGLP
ncbi:SMP-30/gluconolactonase/LRE family protein [Ramlibacter sp.]|uniref:SMP-30/gluconolactonase/LRE family protein n=1 Tax=Ramlibacter sp. TaxID=1917967 RepID=UPI002C0D3974|nr:SMP-30/gluconolactonase/LRE family protein [Ramlibacter sp.]HWI81706.1 SMP-30/gluconolactonase/LRE family protein [Ramlibacter sp.]